MGDDISYEDHESEILRVIDERDYWEEKATILANMIGDKFGVDFGEHSSANCPVDNAIEYIENFSEK